MSKRLIGYGYTNANGVATLDYDAEGNELESSGYVGQGVGEVDISASAVIDGSTFVSVPCNVWDTVYHDETTSETDTQKYYINSASNTAISYEDSKIKITCGTNSGRNMVELRSPFTPTTMAIADLTGKRVKFQVDINNTANKPMKLQVIQTVNGESVTTTQDEWTGSGTKSIETDIDASATLVRFQINPVGWANTNTYSFTNVKVYYA